MSALLATPSWLTVLSNGANSSKSRSRLSLSLHQYLIADTIWKMIAAKMNFAWPMAMVETKKAPLDIAAQWGKPDARLVRLIRMHPAISTRWAAPIRRTIATIRISIHPPLAVHLRATETLFSSMESACPELSTAILAPPMSNVKDTRANVSMEFANAVATRQHSAMLVTSTVAFNATWIR